MEQVTRLAFPVVSFRHLETPFEKKGYRSYFAVVDLKELPLLKGWRQINVRDPKLTGSVPTAIRTSARENPEMFVFMNRGLVIAVDSVEFNNKTSQLTITLKNPQLHGLLDGGHTYNILIEEKDALPHSQYVRVEFLEGFNAEEIPNVVDARNTSNAVRDQSLMNLQGKFDGLKKALEPETYSGDIAYKEYEVDENNEPKPIDIRDIIALLTVFDRDHFTAREHPINAYRSKAACLQYFSDRTASYEKLYPLACDILKLYDEIQACLPQLYNENGGKFGKLTGVTTYTSKRKPRLLFTGKEMLYGVPEGFVYPILGAFRALVEEKGGKFIWGKKLDPIKLLQGDLGKQLSDTIGNFALEHRNPSKTGKFPSVWQACYSLGEIAYLRA